MVSKQTLVQILPPFRNEKRLIKHRQNTDNIIDEILLTHDEYFPDYDLIYTYFDKYYPDASGREIFDFCKKYLKYTIESEQDQTVKSPAAILHPGEKIDCKHYSLFIGGIIDAIKRNEDANIDWCYRFASYSNDREIEHVFVVLKEKNREIWIDPVLNFFNEKRIPTYYLDEYPMALYKLSGISGQGVSVSDVNSDEAWSNFLFWVQHNIFAMKTLMLIDQQTTKTEVKSWCESQGFDYNQLIIFLNAN